MDPADVPLMIAYRTAYALARDEAEFAARTSMTAGHRGPARADLLAELERRRGRPFTGEERAAAGEGIEDGAAGRRPRW